MKDVYGKARAVLYLAALAIIFSLGGCAKKTDANADSAKGSRQTQKTEIAVFIPGVMSGSAIYQMLADGVQAAAAEGAATGGANVTVVEAGYNQAEWETKLTALAAQEAYDLIVSSNPSLPDIASRVSLKFPQARFLLLDAKLSGNPAIYTLRYNQREQSYMAGYLGALIDAEKKGKKRLGLVAAQNYPVMDNIILPGYLEGAQAALPGASVDFRIVGNWSDADKAMELASGMIQNGVKVILTIAGSGNDGVAQAAAKKNAQVLWFDINAYDIKPGVIAGCSVLRQQKAAYDKTLAFLRGELPFGTAETVGIRDGYVDFIDDDPLYLSTVSAGVREKQAAMLQKLRSGSLRLPEGDDSGPVIREKL